MVRISYRRRTWLSAALAIASWILLPAGIARAFDLPGPDAAALGQGGATVASTFVVGGFVLNPALLGTSLKGLRFSGGLRVDARRAMSRRLGDTAVHGAETPLGPIALPMFTARGSLGSAHLSMGAWYVERGGAQAWFPGKDPNDSLVPTQWDRQRYGALSYRLRRHHFGVALAWRPVPWLSLGVGAAGLWMTLEHARVHFTGTDGRAETPSDDLNATLSLKDAFVPVGLFGLLLRPTRSLRLGLAFEVTGISRLKGRAILATPVQYGRVQIHIEEADASLRFRPPWTLRFGVGTDIGPVSLDASVHLTAPVDRTSLTAHAPGLLIENTGQPGGPVPITALDLGIVFRRRLSLAAGIRVAVVPRVLYLAAGYGFAQGETDPAHRSAALVSPDRHLFSGGVTFRHGLLRFDVSYARVLAVSRSHSSRALQSNLFHPDAAALIGSGRQSLSGDLIALTVSMDIPYSP